MLDLENLPKKGAIVGYKVRGAEFQATINNARVRYGTIDVELVPIAGTGSFWVQFDKLNSTDTVGEQLAELAGVQS